MKLLFAGLAVVSSLGSATTHQISSQVPLSASEIRVAKSQTKADSALRVQAGLIQKVDSKDIAPEIKSLTADYNRVASQNKKLKAESARKDGIIAFQERLIDSLLQASVSRETIDTAEITFTYPEQTEAKPKGIFRKWGIFGKGKQKSPERSGP